MGQFLGVNTKSLTAPHIFSISYCKFLAIDGDPMHFNILVFISVLFLSTISHAQDIYYWGETRGHGAQTEVCAVKIHGSLNSSQIQVEALAYMAHEAEFIYTGLLELDFNAKLGAYVFQSTEPAPTINQAAVFLNDKAEVARFAVSILHGNHYDPSFCENLTVAPLVDEAEIEALFVQYEEEGADHDHHHDHHHDHGHHH